MAETLRIMTLAAAVVLSACQGGGLAGSDDDREPARLLAGTEQMTLGTAKTHFRENNFALAEKSFQDVLKHDASHVEAWLGLAASYDRLGRYDLADVAYDRVISVGGRRPEILNNLGYSYFLRGDKARARATFEEAVRIAPDNPVVQANLVLVSG